MGKVHGRKTIELAIPEELRDGMTMRLKGLGEPGDDAGEAGDLYLTLRLVSDATYRVSGNDVEGEVIVAPWEALFGAKVHVQTPTGRIVLTVPPETRAGARLRVRGKGLADGRGGRGDFFAVIRLAVPADLSARQRELLREAAAAGPSTVTGGARRGTAS